MTNASNLRHVITRKFYVNDRTNTLNNFTFYHYFTLNHELTNYFVTMHFKLLCDRHTTCYFPKVLQLLAFLLASDTVIMHVFVLPKSPSCVLDFAGNRLAGHESSVLINGAQSCSTDTALVSISCVWSCSACCHYSRVDSHKHTYSTSTATNFDIEYSYFRRLNQRRHQQFRTTL